MNSAEDERPDGTSRSGCSGVPPDVMNGSMCDLFEDVVRRHGDRVAVGDMGLNLSYDELNDAANRIAQRILDLRGDKSEGIAFLLENGAPGLAAILGILKAGKMYVPLDPSIPRARTEYIIRDAEVPLLLTVGPHLDQARAMAGSARVIDISDYRDGPPVSNPGITIAPETFANIFYTSGSTGTPKGVVNRHSNLVHEGLQRAYRNGFSVDDRMPCTNSFSFSGSLWKIYPAIFIGASVYPYDMKRRGVAQMPKWIRDNQLTAFGGRASIRQLMRHCGESECFESVRLVSLGGDTIYRSDIERCRKLFDPEVIVIGYGSTEAGSVTRYWVPDDAELPESMMPVGTSSPGKEVLLLDDEGREVPDGEVGEFAVKSRYLAWGYWKRPEATKEKFREVPGEEGVFMFLTGDLGRKLPDGNMVHLGRKDFQVKVRGYRIETPEVERALLDLPQVSETIVVGRQVEETQKELVAYIIPADGFTPSVSEVRSALSAQLPDYEVPSRYVFVESLPRTSTGKIDRNQLPEPATTRPNIDSEFVPPGTPVEKALAGIWEDILKVSPIGVNDPFLDLGGHSLKAAQVITRVQEAFEVTVEMALLLNSPTVAAMAAIVTEGLANQLEGESIGAMLDDLEETGEV